MLVCRPTSGLPPSTSSSSSAHAYHALAELLGEPDEQSFGAADVAEPIRVLVLNHVANELRAARAEPGERRIDVVHGEHDAEIAERVHRGVPVIGDGWRGEKARELKPTMAIGRD